MQVNNVTTMPFVEHWKTDILLHIVESPLGAGPSVVNPGYWKLVHTLTISCYRSGRKGVGTATHKAFLHKGPVIP